MAATDPFSREQTPHMPDESDLPAYMAVLAEKLLQGRATVEEEDLLEHWYRRQGPAKQLVFLNETGLAKVTHGKARFKRRLLERIQASADIPSSSAASDQMQRFRFGIFSARQINRSRIRWGVISVAAVFLVVFGWSLLRQQTQSVNPAVAAIQPVVPGSDGAILTLSDGRQIVLDSTVEGQIAADAQSRLIKRGGVLNYEPAGGQPGRETVYNTMTTPKGRQFQLILPDGTKVWLNAASSIYYPTAFTGPERKVRVTGEVYFEVTHRPRQPFIVQTGATDIEVLGTRFDVMAYDDEAAQTTTLLEGKVLLRSLKAPGRPVYLHPGQQAVIHHGIVSSVMAADTGQVTAWVNGKLSMKNLDVATLMRQIARWYAIDIQYAGPVPEGRFGGVLNRSAQLKSVLEVMELNGIHTKLEGRTLIVDP